MKLKKSTLALATLIEHPDWNDDRIAKYIGVQPDTLRRMKAYRWGLEIMNSRPDGRKTSVNARTGEIEMWQDSTEEDV